MINRNKIIKYLFFLLVIRPFIFLVLGVNVRNFENLPKDGPALIIANHNSHIDTLLLMSLFGINLINKVRPVAAADYFCNTKLRKFLFETLIGIIPISRKVEKKNADHIFDKVFEALDSNNIVIVYPEGSRGEDSKIQKFKTGIAYVARRYPKVPIIPIYMSGPDKILPKIDSIIVPFISDVYVGEKFYYDGKTVKEFTEEVRERVYKLM